MEAGGRTTTLGMPAEASVLPARCADVAERSTIIQSYTVFSRLSVEKPCRFAERYRRNNVRWLWKRFHQALTLLYAEENAV